MCSSISLIRIGRNFQSIKLNDKAGCVIYWNFMWKGNHDDNGGRVWMKQVGAVWPAFCSFSVFPGLVSLPPGSSVWAFVPIISSDLFLQVSTNNLRTLVYVAKAWGVRNMVPWRHLKLRWMRAEWNLAFPKSKNMHLPNCVPLKQSLWVFVTGLWSALPSFFTSHPNVLALVTCKMFVNNLNCLFWLTVSLTWPTLGPTWGRVSWWQKHVTNITHLMADRRQR